MNWWNNIVEYYATIGERYNVDPIIFVGIHIVATPVFAAVIGWMIYNKKNRKSILIPALVAVFVFNAASIYLIIFGRDIPLYIYLIVILSAVVGGFFTYRKVKKRIVSIK
ncbi:MAG: hypothetical protein JWQ09_2783 [Segetibacter sp.]|nr:hypothetical protein [Segetibacter sp.]